VGVWIVRSELVIGKSVGWIVVDDTLWVSVSEDWLRLEFIGLEIILVETLSYRTI